ncbi:MAG: hypothetical protein A3K60_03415 [Euryarchaeota archaeon RBG_19FT_COMBO_56_21]|nr:MAG: hypothetical protein A3K60_03415 [Euryarchaeota archaeon RBG_19FT_COMBO_56_21]
MQDEWTEKYRPKSLAEVIGNDHAVRSIRRWADSWARGTPRLKALVLRGEPGTGKTSASLALANDMGWDFIEMNASDHRNAASIKKVAGAGAVTQTFTPDGDFLSSVEGKRKLVIIDEADNLFGNEDRGGAKAIVDTIRDSGQPIVLIVNDYRELTRKASAIKTLAERVVFKRLDPKSIVSVLESIASKEQVRVDSDVLTKIAENCGGDMRAAVNDLQMMVEGKVEIGLTDSDAMGKRNQLKELNDSLRAMFGAKTLKSARDATLDIDRSPDELEKWIEEGIPLEFRHAGDMEEAFEALARADIYLGWTRRSQNYGLWAYAKDMMTGGVALSRKHGPRPDVQEYRFPSHIMMLSRAKGPRAARDSISRKLEGHLHMSRRAINASVLPLLTSITRNDSELLVNLGAKCGLDEDDIGFLVGADPDSKQVLEIVSKIKAELGEDHDDEPTGRRSSKSKDGKRSLKDF